MKNIHTYTHTHTYIYTYYFYVIIIITNTTTTKIHRDEFGIDVEQLEIMQGALDLKKIKTKDVMVPLNEAFMLSCDDKLDANKMADILNAGVSRIPVYDTHPHNIVGLLIVKKLIALNPSDARPIKSILVRKPIVLPLNLPLLEALSLFTHGKARLGIVTDSVTIVEDCLKNKKQIPANVHMAGIITMHDIFEEIVKQELGDDESSKLNNLGKQLTEGMADAPRFNQERLRRMTILAHTMKRRVSRKRNNLIKFEQSIIEESNSLNNNNNSNRNLKQPLLTSISDSEQNEKKYYTNIDYDDSKYYTNTAVPNVGKSSIRRNDTV